MLKVLTYKLSKITKEDVIDVALLLWLVVMIGLFLAVSLSV